MLLLVVVAPALAKDCQPVDLHAVVQQGVQAILDYDENAARGHAERARASLACLDAVAAPADLADIWLVLAAAAFYDGHPDVAEPNLAQANAVDAGFYEEVLGYELRDLWHRVAAEPRAQASIRVAPVPEGAELLVDGRARYEQPVVVDQGYHLIQVAMGSEVLFGRVLDLGPDQAADVATGLLPPSSPASVPWFALGAGAAAVAAAGAYGTALLLDGQLEEAAKADDGRRYARLDDWSWALGTKVAPGLVGVAGACVALHFWW
jgi:hypothetical protein